MSRRSDGRRIARVSSHGPPCGKEATTRRRRSRVLLFLLTNQPPKNPAAYKELRHKSRNRPIHGALIAFAPMTAVSDVDHPCRFTHPKNVGNRAEWAVLQHGIGPSMIFTHQNAQPATDGVPSFVQCAASGVDALRCHRPPRLRLAPSQDRPHHFVVVQNGAFFHVASSGCGSPLSTAAFVAWTYSISSATK